MNFSSLGNLTILLLNFLASMYGIFHLMLHFVVLFSSQQSFLMLSGLIIVSMLSLSLTVFCLFFLFYVIFVYLLDSFFFSIHNFSYGQALKVNWAYTSNQREDTSGFFRPSFLFCCFFFLSFFAQ